MNTKGCIDLHTHTTASDGSLSPSELVRYARDEGLYAVAITDHDTADGLPEALEEAEKAGMVVIPGVELSGDFKPEMHILGYFKGDDYRGLNDILKLIRKNRLERNPRIIEKLNSLGFDITIDEVLRESGGNVVGRAHIAGVMLKKGYVRSVDEAFALYLGEGKPAYAEREKLTPEQCIKEICKNNGIAVLAHPVYLGLGPGHLETLVRKLMDYGLRGIEAYYTDHSEELTAQYVNLAQKLGLIVTGGSDFHGSYKPDVRLAKGHGKLHIPAGLLESLREALEV